MRVLWHACIGGYGSVPSIFFLELWRLVRQQDLVLLVGGSAYMDTWTSALLWAFLWVTPCAHVMRKPCLAPDLLRKALLARLLADTAAALGLCMPSTHGMWRVVYRAIAINFEGQPDGDICISRCFFSEAYTPEVCRVDVGTRRWPAG